MTADTSNSTDKRLNHDQMYRTHALLTENPEDDLRLHHVFWVYGKSFDADKAAQGLGDISKHEIDSCLVLSGEAFDLTPQEAVLKLAELEKAETVRGGTIAQDAEDGADDSWPRSKLGRDFINAVHHSRFEAIAAAARDDMARQATILSGDLTLPPAVQIKSRVLKK
ncbi:MAG: hypothetical protein Q8K65_06265 [Alphaproteobacteria bacterium]|nr:hypothetical protein [Alphaproteobacteria bacterium]